MKKKSFQELSIADDFMFSAVMMTGDLCKQLLEMILEIKISDINISYEKSIVYHPEYKGVRLDVYAEDENHTHYDIEMQLARVHIGHRSRYYHSQMDMELLPSGEDYYELPNSYVIFICDFDPLRRGLYKYTIISRCEEVPDVNFDDGRYTICLSTKGKNEKEVPKELVSFLQYVNDGPKGNDKDYNSDYVRSMQRTVRRIKKDRDMEKRYMRFEDIMRDRYQEGLKKGEEIGKKELLKETILEDLSELGYTSADFNSFIEEEDDIEKLKTISRYVRRCQSLEELITFIKNN